jgi:hypothetical protein
MKRFCFLFSLFLSVNVYSAPECQSSDDCVDNSSGPFCWGGRCGFIVINRDSETKKFKYNFSSNLILNNEISDMPTESLHEILEINSSVDALPECISKDF